MKKQEFLKKVNKILHALPVYQNEIDLDSIFDALETYGGMAVQEDNTRWSGILCGETGYMNLHVHHADFKNAGLTVTWYKMGSGRYEVLSYVS